MTSNPTNPQSPQKEERTFRLYILLTAVNLILPTNGYAQVSIFAQQIIPMLPRDAKVIEIQELRKFEAMDGI